VRIDSVDLGKSEHDKDGKIGALMDFVKNIPEEVEESEKTNKSKSDDSSFEADVLEQEVSQNLFMSYKMSAGVDVLLQHDSDEEENPFEDSKSGDLNATVMKRSQV
jgi:hypothetical protein